MHLFYLLLSLLTVSAIAPHREADLDEAIRSFVADPALAGSAVSISVVDIQANQLLASYQPDLALIPASSLKTLTTAGALLTLGPDFQFETELAITGPIRNGILEGDVIIRGGGDPSLGSGEWNEVPNMRMTLNHMLLGLKSIGIKQVDGLVIGDGSLFPKPIEAPSWEEKDMGNYYAGGAWGLNLNENLYHLHFRQNPKLGAIPAVEATEPNVPGIQFNNTVRSAGKNTGDNAYIHGRPGQFARLITGTIPVGSGRFTIKGSIPHPPLFAAQHLRWAMIQAGIHVARPAYSMDAVLQQGYQLAKNRRRVLAIQSPALKDLVRETNMRSVNLYCEAMLRKVGHRISGTASREAGLTAMRKIWTDRGLDLSSTTLEDGSGLSELNRIPSRVLASVLRKAAVDKDLFPHMLNALPKAGYTGNMEHKLQGTAAQGRVWVKSGTLKQVRAYAGYLKAGQGRWVSFAILVNNIPGSSGLVRDRMDQLMLDMVKAL